MKRNEKGRVLSIITAALIVLTVAGCATSPDFYDYEMPIDHGTGGGGDSGGGSGSGSGAGDSE